MKLVVRDHDTHRRLEFDLPDGEWELTLTGDLRLYQWRQVAPSTRQPFPVCTLAHGQWLAVVHD